MDKEAIHNLSLFLQVLEKVPKDTKAIISVASPDVPHWYFLSGTIYNLIMLFIFEGPALRQELDEAAKEIEALKAQLASVETLTSEEPPKWEHKVISVGHTNVRDDIREYNLLGEEGWALEEAFSGDFTSLKERFRLKGTKILSPTSLEELMMLRKELFQQFSDEVLKRLL